MTFDLIIENRNETYEKITLFKVEENKNLFDVPNNCFVRSARPNVSIGQLYAQLKTKDIIGRRIEVYSNNNIQNNIDLNFVCKPEDNVDHLTYVPINRDDQQMFNYCPKNSWFETILMPKTEILCKLFLKP